MNHIHSIYDTDQHFIIDPITRSITSETDKVTLMQNDHLSERFTFEIPRYVEGHDMSLTDKVEIHYINIDGANKRNTNKDIYEVADLQLSPDDDNIVICSWLISKNATMYAGTLQFVLRFVCYSENSIEYQWFTDIFAGIKILSAIYNVDVLDPNYGIDVIEAWRREIVAATEELSNQAIESAAQAAASAEAAAEAQADVDAKAQQAAESEKNALEAATEVASNVEITVTKANEASDSAQLAKSYAVGDTGTRDGEDTDNAKHYADVASTLYAEALSTLDKAEQTLEEVGQAVTNTSFELNYETGELSYTDPDRVWSVNLETGNLEMEVI